MHGAELLVYNKNSCDLVMSPECVKFDLIIKQCDILFHCSITYDVASLWLPEVLFEHVFYLRDLFPECFFFFIPKIYNRNSSLLTEISYNKNALTLRLKLATKHATLSVSIVLLAEQKIHLRI